MLYAMCFSVFGGGLLLFLGFMLGVIYFRRERTILSEEASRNVDLTMAGLKRQGLFPVTFDMGNNITEHLNKLPYISATFDEEIGLLSFDLDNVKMEYFDQYSKGNIDEIIIKAMEFDRLKEDTEKVVASINDAQTARVAEKMKEAGISVDRLLLALITGKKFIDQQRIPPEWCRASEGDKKALQVMKNFDPFKDVPTDQSTRVSRAEFTYPTELVDIINGKTEHDEVIAKAHKEQMKAANMLQATTGLVTFRADGIVEEDTPVKPHNYPSNGLSAKPAQDHDTLIKEETEKLRTLEEGMAGSSKTGSFIDLNGEDAKKLLEESRKTGFFINVDEEDAKKILESHKALKKALQKKRIVNPRNGKIEMRYNPLAADEDIFIPVRNVNDPTVVELLKKLNKIPNVDLTTTTEPHPHCTDDCCKKDSFDKWYNDACDEGAC